MRHQRVAAARADRVGRPAGQRQPHRVQRREAGTGVAHDRNGSRRSLGTVHPSRTAGSAARISARLARNWVEISARSSSSWVRSASTTSQLVARQLEVDDELDSGERVRGQVGEPLARASAATGARRRRNRGPAARSGRACAARRTRSCRRRLRAPRRSSRSCCRARSGRHPCDRRRTKPSVITRRG